MLCKALPPSWALPYTYITGFQCMVNWWCLLVHYGPTLIGYLVCFSCALSFLLVGSQLEVGKKKESAILTFQLADMVTLTTEQKVALACCQMATTHTNQSMCSLI